MADFEAGIGTLTRLDPGDVDVLLVVVEPTPKSIEIGSRATDLARDKGIGRIIVVASRVRDGTDRARIGEAIAADDLVVVPFDEQIIAADREGVAPLDLAPQGAAVSALRELSARLAPA